MMDHVVDDYEALRDFLLEAELHQYYELFRDILKVSKLSQLKYVTIEDLAQIGLSKPEQRRYKKLYTKYFPNNYMSKIKKLLSANKKHETFNHGLNLNTVDFQQYPESSTKVSPRHIISIEDITINKELGMGQFGVVQQGTWATGNQRLQVAIKCLGNERMTSNSTEFLKEAAVMHSIEHPSIVRLYGVVLHMDSLMLVTELAPLRSLLECLREVTFRSNFPVPNLCEFAEQICDGMTYLENKRLIHRDLAARNILVFSKDRVKISDFGLSRALGVGKDYYQTNYNVNLKLPVAWCAPECILYLRFTSASDVWAFGVCLWEMFTYGFQPWVAFSGQQILEAIDAPNFQRLERPECCPDAYYSLMLECWSHDPNNRPKFKDLKPRLKQIRPEEVQAIGNQQRSEEGRRSNFLEYKIGQKITVLGKEDFTKTAMWYGVLSGGTCGLFDPNNTKPIIKNERSQSLEPGSFSPHPSRSIRPSLLRSDAKRHTVMGKRSIQRSMISSPQGDVKHTGHVGADGAYFGDISFLDPAGCPPRQIVTPYRPSEDLEQVPLINPNSPSHLTAASTPYPLLTSSFEPRPSCDQVDLACVDTKQKPIKKGHLKSVLEPTTSKSLLSKVKSATLGRSHKTEDGGQGRTPETHEYHEISDTDTESTATDNAKVDIPSPDAVITKASTDFSKSLIDEMESMFRNLDDRRRNEINLHHEIDAAIRAHTLNKAEKKKSFHTATMKLMSAHDTRTLDTAVALANEITSKSMTGLDETKLPTSPSERLKFHFKFPLVSLHHNNHHEGDKEICGKRNFSEEAKSVQDIQETITEESRMVYASLIEEPTPAISAIKLPQEKPSTSTIPKETRNQSPKVNFNSLPSTSCEVIVNHPVADTLSNDGNEIPLPPRTTKPKLVDKPRHVRKHPLRIPVCCEPLPAQSAASTSQAPVTIYQNIRAVIQNDYSEGVVRDNPSMPDPATNPFYPSYSGAIALPDLSNNPFNCYISNLDAKTDEGEDEIFEEVFLKGEACGGERSGDIDHVSVEDLLQFADKKPSSQQRGVESDEVRIMNKVLKKISPEECLEALEFTDWNIHIAIKLLKMKIAVAGSGETKFEELRQELESADGDVPKATAAFINLNKKEDV
ncbi:activated Cdc42 kinase-like isoform X2 [Pieris rapae]|uniref:activated Cdc42 kinase-like isoform X2 n=1 Tax=Pieris rapae TaxID=64459 RepID=UPI000B929E18|nr:activated Cdc42 kinase-like isoform X2 [Pieris rapae]